MERSIVIARSIGQVWQEAVPRRMVVLAFVEPEDIREAKRQSVAESRQRKAALQKQHVVPEPEPKVVGRVSSSLKFVSGANG